MNLLYFTSDYSEKSNGVKLKIDNQIKTLNEYYDVSFITCENKTVLGKITDYKKSLKQDEIDIVYVRNTLAGLLFHRFIFKYSFHRKIFILEMPTPVFNFINEIKTTESNYVKRMIKLLLVRSIYPKVFKYFDLVVEYAPENHKYSNGYEDKIIYIQNGIDMSKVPLNNYGYQEKQTLDLIGVANINYWHGYDRIIKGLAAYYNDNPSKEVNFHIVGNGPELSNLKQIANDLEIDTHIIFHGIKIGSELDEIFDKCDIGVGSIGNHRKGLYEDSALKNREYCARGIPFIIASEDYDFNENFKYVHRITKDDKVVDIKKIVKFYESIQYANYKSEMRDYAESNLTWEVKMKKVVCKVTKIRGKKILKAK